MNLITIPKKLAAGDDLVVVPRKEYEALQARAVKEFTPTKTDLKALARARKNFAAGRTIPYDDVRRELGLNHRSKRS